MVSRRSVFAAVCGLVVGVVAGWLAHRHWMPATAYVRCDTITRVEARTIIQPVPRDSLIVRWKTISMRDTLRDTLTQVVRVGDSVRIPISQREYGDSLYTAWVSGYDPHLDSIRLRIPTSEVHIIQPAKRWAFGVQGGVGVTPKGVQPYIGIGISYRIGGRK